MEKKRSGFLRSFVHAFRGIGYLFRSERNAQVQLFIFVLAIILGAYLRLSLTEWTLLLICGFAVLGAEAINTALEKTLDALHPELHPAIGKAKDIAAGAVLLISIGAALVGLLIFIPHF